MITSIDCEKLIVSFCMQGRSATQLVAEKQTVDEGDFSDTDLRILYGTCVALYGQKKEVNALQVQNFLNSKVLDTHFLGKPEGKKQRIEKLISLSEEIAKDFNFLKQLTDPYTACNTIKTEAKRRKTISTIHEVHQQILSTDSLDTVLQHSIGELLELQKKFIGSKGYISVNEAIAETEQLIDAEMNGKIIRLRTGIPSVDKMIHGLENGALYVLAAEEKVGKSFLAGQIALNISKEKIPVGIISMEMKPTELIRRFSGASKWHTFDKQKKAIEQFKRERSNTPLYIKSGSGNSIKIISTIQDMVNSHHVQCIIVDYLQLVDVKTKGNDIRVNEVNNFVSALKGAAQDLNIPIILISAVLNKQVANNRDKKPTPADLRDSGRIANDCDVLLFLWKPEEDMPEYLELFVSRGRNGEYGKCSFILNKDTLRLEETTLREEVPLQEYIPKKSSFGKKW